MLTGRLANFVERLKHVPGIVTIVVGGSKARGTADTSSDTDLGFALNREHWMNEKGALALASRFNLVVPPRFKERVERVWQLLAASGG
jgi:predicted nucleotidyltransferase